MLEPDKLLLAQPQPTRGATREDLFPAGHFGSYSYAICQRGDIPPACKLVFFYICDHLRGKNAWVMLPLERIVRMMRIKKRSAQFWIAWLCDRGFMERRGRPGKSNHFRVAHPDVWPPDPDPLPACPGRIDEAAPVENNRGQSENQPLLTRPAAGVPLGPPPDITKATTTETNNTAVVGNSLNSLRQENVDVLTRIGVTSGAAAKLAATIGLTPIKLILLALEAKSNPAGYVRRRIEAGAIEPKPGWTAQKVAAGIRSGWLPLIDGFDLDGPGVEARPFPQGLSIRRDGEKIGEVSTARLRELAGGPTDQQRRADGSKRAGEQKAADDRRRADVFQAERWERRQYFDSLSVSRRTELIERAAADGGPQKPEAVADRAIGLAWNGRVDLVVAGMDEYGNSRIGSSDEPHGPNA